MWLVSGLLFSPAVFRPLENNSGSGRRKKRKESRSMQLLAQHSLSTHSYPLLLRDPARGARGDGRRGGRALHRGGAPGRSAGPGAHTTAHRPGTLPGQARRLQPGDPPGGCPLLQPLPPVGPAGSLRWATGGATSRGREERTAAVCNWSNNT